MSASDDTKAAPSLADDFVLEVDMGDMVGVLSLTAWFRKNRDTVAAALRAVEAVRAFNPTTQLGGDESDELDLAFRGGFIRGARAVQAILEGEL